MESASTHKTEYHIVYFYTDAPVCAYHVTSFPPGEQRLASQIYLKQEKAPGKIPGGFLKGMKVF